MRVGRTEHSFFNVSDACKLTMIFLADVHWHISTGFPVCNPAANVIGIYCKCWQSSISSLCTDTWLIYCFVNCGMDLAGESSSISLPLYSFDQAYSSSWSHLPEPRTSTLGYIILLRVTLSTFNVGESPVRDSPVVFWGTLLDQAWSKFTCSIVLLGN